MKKLYQLILATASFVLFGQQSFYVQITTLTPTSCSTLDGILGSQITGGTAPFSYTWRNADGQSNQILGTGPTLENVAKDITYSLDVVDANGEIATDTIGHMYFGAYTNTKPANCPAADGEASVIYFGNYASPVSILWSNGATDSLITGLSAGEQLTVQISDANGCRFQFYEQQGGGNSDKTIGTATVGSNASFDVDHTYSPATCNDPDGLANINVTNGDAPYTYLWNTSPVRTTATATGLTTGNYTVRITDNQGCYEDYGFYLSNTSGSLTGYTYHSDEMCLRANGSVNLVYSGGQAPYSVQWSTGASNVNTITNIQAGYYTVTVTDANDCKIVKSELVRRESPIYLGFAITPADCDNLNGAVDLIPNGGTEPYTYQWSNGASSEDISNLSIGYYSAYVTDNEGCTAFSYRFLNTAANCQGLIHGKVYQDNNSNCTYDAGEPQLQNYFLSGRNTVSNYNMCARTNVAGDYSFTYPYNGNYAVANHSSSPHYSTQCPGVIQSVNAIAPNDYVVNFGMVPVTIGPDLRTYLSSSWVRPGFTHHYTLYVRNVGTEILDAGYVEVQLGSDEELMYFSETPIAYDATTHVVRFPLSNIEIGGLSAISFSCKIPPTTLLNTKYTVTATANPVSGDLVEEDNVFALQQTVVGSYDPNDIQSFKTGDLILDEDTALTYHIRFQNTGTFFAEFIIVRDTLEADLDPATLRDVVASHPVSVRIVNGNVVEFAFENIFLPDSTSDEQGSHGFVSYRINLKDGLAYGDEVKNSAAIYFDYNAPVITNEVNNIVATPTGIIKAASNNQKAWAYPNPAKDVVRFTFDTPVQSIELMNVSGQLVRKDKVNGNEIQINTPASKGLYYYKAIDNNGFSYTGKLVVE